VQRQLFSTSVRLCAHFERCQPLQLRVLVLLPMTLRVKWTHFSMPTEPEEAAGAPLGLGAALGAAAAL
jgi:hypothetical protein